MNDHTTDNPVPAFELTGLTKRFGPKVAVDRVELTIPQGSLFGLVGSNGAGKTTSLSMGVGLLRPDAGTARIFGVDVWDDPESAKSLVGVLPDGLALPERLTGRELLTYLGQLRGMDPADIDRRADDLLTTLELAPTESTLVIEYSAGMRKKIGLAAALLHAPRLLVLDEPFESIDPVSTRIFSDILRRFVAGGGSVVFSSHAMAMVEQLCDHVAVIGDGRMLAAGRLDEVRDGLSLEDRFLELVGIPTPDPNSMDWFTS